MKANIYFHLFLFSVLILCTNINAQNVTSLKPGNSYENNSEKDVFIVLDGAFTKLLENADALEISKKRINLLLEQVAVLQERISLSDSAITIKKLESQFWYDKLLETDEMLKKERLARTKFWNSRTFWFIIGALTASAVISAK